MPATTPATLSDVLQAAGLGTLGENPPPDAVEAALRNLAKLLDGSDALRVATAREMAIQPLKEAGISSPAALVDAAFGTAKNPAEKRQEGQGRAMTLDEPEPWPDPVDGAALLDEMEHTFTRFLSLPEGAAPVLALWTLHAHAHDAADVSPLLALTSPEKRCGKTTTLTLVGALVPRKLPASNISPAALFRAVEAYRPTLLVDEADTFLKQNEELRGILNSGHTRSGAVVVRTVGENFDPHLFSTWGAKAVAMIGTLPGTLEDRSVVVQLRRQAPGEKKERLRLDRLGTLEPLRRKAARWTADHLDGLRSADPDVPEGLHDRAADNWRPLLAIADAAGGAWPEQARKAAALLGGVANDGDSAGPMLLADVRDVFKEKKVDRLPSADLVTELVKMEERPWPEWSRGNPLSATGLARLLKPFGVHPKQMKHDGEKTRGYDRADFADAFSRYLTPFEAVPPVPSSNGKGFPASGKRYPPKDGTGCGRGENPRHAYDVPGVPAENPRTGEEPALVPDDLFRGEAA